VPSFQVADEGSHYQRAYQVSKGEFFPQKKVDPKNLDGYTVGGTISPAIHKVEAGYLPIAFKPDVKVDIKTSIILDNVIWGDDKWGDTRNVSIYPPFLYAVSSLGIILGKSAELTVSDTLILSRLLNGILALLLSTIAIFMVSRGTAVLFCILILPMTIAQTASVSPDAISFPFAALCAAIISRFNAEKIKSFNISLVICSVLLILISMTRPPYIALSMLFLVFALKNWGNKEKRIKLVMAFLISFIFVAAWSLYLTLNVSVPFGPEGVSYMARVKQILTSPLEWTTLLINSFVEYYVFYFTSFIGRLGYLDVSLPAWYYMLSGVSLFIATLPVKTSFPSELKKSELSHNLLILLVLCITTIGIFLVLSISWTPIASATIQGVQGRYFIPIALFLCLTASSSNKYGLSPLVKQKFLLLFGIITAIVVPLAVTNRYY